MKFIHYITKITGIDVMGLASFAIFFILFVAMALWAWRADKGLIDNLSRLPLDNNEPALPSKIDLHETV